MRSFRVVLTAIVFALGSSNVPAQQWFNISPSHWTDETVSIDLSSVGAHDSYKKAWVLVNHVSPQTSPAGKIYRSQVVMVVFNCRERSQMPKQAYYYADPDGKGSVVDNFRMSSLTFLDVPPNSIGDLQNTLVCDQGR